MPDSVTMAVSATTRAPHGRNRVGPPDTRVGPDDRDTVPPSCRWCHAWVPSWNVEAAHHSGAARWSDHPSVPFRRSQVLRGVSGLSYHFWVRNGLPPLPTTGPDPTPSGAPSPKGLRLLRRRPETSQRSRCPFGRGGRLEGPAVQAGEAAPGYPAGRLLPGRLGHQGRTGRAGRAVLGHRPEAHGVDRVGIRFHPDDHRSVPLEATGRRHTGVVRLYHHGNGAER